MGPALDAPLIAGRAAFLQRAGATGLGQIDSHIQIVLLCGEVIGEHLASRAAIGILFGEINKIILAKAAIGLGASCLRLGQGHGDTCLFARQEFFVAEVAPICDHLEPVRV